jgi:hypothetical protein
LRIRVIRYSSSDRRGRPFRFARGHERLSGSSRQVAYGSMGRIVGGEEHISPLQNSQELHSERIFPVQ